MTQFAQPLLSLIIGIALAIYGSLHATNHIPPAGAIHAFWAAMPGLTAVIIFLLGVVAVISGLWLITSGAQGLRRRQRQITRIYGRHEEPYEDEQDYDHPYR